MAVSTDTIQTLLRQRQDLREALLELRKEIETLDASSLDLVNRNIKTAPPAKATTPAGEVIPTGSPPAKVTAAPAPAAAAPATSETKAAPAPKPTVVEAAPAPAPALQPVAQAVPEKTEPVLTAPAEPAPENPAKEEPKEEPKAEPAPARETKPVAPEPTREDSAKDEGGQEESKKEVPKKEEVKPPVAAASEAEEAGDHDDLNELLEKARALSDYLLDHPSSLPASELGALDAAITVSESAKTAAEKKACYHTLQAAYRKISAGSFAASGVSGTTLLDSEAGAPLLWTIPFAISLLIIVLFPLLLLTRHLAGEMFTDDFASDVTWSIGLVAAFLWGTVGALTLLTLNIALVVRRRRFDGGIRLSPGLRGALGGLTGGLVFLALEVWVTGSDAATDFALDLAAFAGGLLSAVLFASLQSLLSLLIGLLEPAKPKPAASRPEKK